MAYDEASRMLRQGVGNCLTFHPCLQAAQDFLVRLVVLVTAAGQRIPRVAQHVDDIQSVVDLQWGINAPMSLEFLVQRILQGSTYS